MLELSDEQIKEIAADPEAAEHLVRAVIKALNRVELWQDGARTSLSNALTFHDMKF